MANADSNSEGTGDATDFKSLFALCGLSERVLDEMCPQIMEQFVRIHRLESVGPHAALALGEATSIIPFILNCIIKNSMARQKSDESDESSANIRQHVVVGDQMTLRYVKTIVASMYENVSMQHHRCSLVDCKVCYHGVVHSGTPPIR